jgi:hypothetical protein
MRSIFPSLIFAASLLAGAPALADQLAADKEALMACVAEAFPEGALPVLAGQEKPVAKKGGDCIGLIERSTAQLCSASTACAERETRAWLALAQGLELDGLPARNKAAVRSGVAGIEKQARATCMAAAAVSAWGRDQVAGGKYRIGLDHPCLRDAVAGLVVPLMGFLRGN